MGDPRHGGGVARGGGESLTRDEMAEVMERTFEECRAFRKAGQAWQGIEGYPNYEVAPDGQVRNKQTLHVLKPRIHKDTGYAMVNLTDTNGRRRNVYVHHAVAAAFIGSRPVGLQINHRNRVKTDNSVANLEYVTRSANTIHAYATGHRAAKLTTKQAVEIRALRPTHSLNQLARLFGVSKGTIVFVTTGKTWRLSQ